MDNCPLLNQLNCRNFEIKCHDCLCTNDERPLQYSPLDKNIIHPYKLKEREKRSQEGRSNRSRGRRNEKTIMNTISQGKVKKSSIGCDGYIPFHSHNLKVEIKTRLNHKSKWPTTQEWGKFLTQGLDIFIVDNGDGDVRCSMTIDTLNSLLNPRESL